MNCVKSQILTMLKLPSYSNNLSHGIKFRCKIVQSTTGWNTFPHSQRTILLCKILPLSLSQQEKFNLSLIQRRVIRVDSKRVKEFGYSCRQRRLTWAKEKKNWTVAQWFKVLFSDERKFCISFGNQGPRV